MYGKGIIFTDVTGQRRVLYDGFFIYNILIDWLDTIESTNEFSLLYDTMEICQQYNLICL